MSGHDYDRGGAPDGTLMVSLQKFYGDETVSIELYDGDTAAHLNAWQARRVGQDLIDHADRLEEISR